MLNRGILFTGADGKESSELVAPYSTRLHHNKVQHADILGHAGAMARHDTDAALLSDDDGDSTPHSAHSSEKDLLQTASSRGGSEAGTSDLKQRGSPLQSEEAKRL